MFPAPAAFIYLPFNRSFLAFWEGSDAQASASLPCSFLISDTWLCGAMLVPARRLAAEISGAWPTSPIPPLALPLPYPCPTLASHAAVELCRGATGHAAGGGAAGRQHQQHNLRQQPTRPDVCLLPACQHQQRRC